MAQVTLTSDLIEAFSGTFLSPRYDNPQATPEFHRKAWALYCSQFPLAGCVAPREHAKSTALTMDFTLAENLFKVSDYTIIIGATEDKAAEQLSNISEELHDNRDLQDHFGIDKFESDTKTDVIVKLDDGHRFRILARGSEQKIRGALWKGKRPNLMVCDDMEDDEQVESKDRRAKFRRWFFRAARQALSSTGRLRVHGTILHEDSLLSRLRKNKEWQFLFYKAHESFTDFSNILWPEQWPEERLRSRQREFVEDGDAPGYSQEFLNEPLDNSDAYLRRADFQSIDDEILEIPRRKCAAADLAVSKADMANRTSFTVGAKNARNQILFLDQRVDRWDPVEWIDEMFTIQEEHNPEIFFVEDGVIWKAVKTMVYNAMTEKDIFINIETVPSIKDKATRGRTLQKRMRAKNCFFDKEADWYAGFEHELLRFTGHTQAVLDDQFDSAALLAIGLENLGVYDDEDFVSEEDYRMERERQHKKQHGVVEPGWRTGYNA